MSSGNQPAAPWLADAVAGALHAVHRGAVVVGADRIVAFGNDGYSVEAVADAAQRVWHWLAWRGWTPSDVSVCADRYTWAIAATPDCGVARAARLADRAVWRAWERSPDASRTARGAGRFQRVLARRELDAIGGGFTDEKLAVPLNGRAGPVRGNLLVNDILLMKVAGGEDVFVALGGVPFPAKMLPLDAPDGLMVAPPPGVEVVDGIEVAVATEDIGDPRHEGGGTATAFVPRGGSIVVKHFGERHEATGRRVVVPVDPLTGEPLPE